MSNYIDIKGQTFGRLTVIEFYGVDKNRQALWTCECSCGTKNVIVAGANLRNQHTKSCGCYRNEKSLEQLNKYREKKRLSKESKNKIPNLIIEKKGGNVNE